MSTTRTAMAILLAAVLPCAAAGQTPCSATTGRGVGVEIGFVQLPLAGGNLAEGLSVGPTFGGSRGDLVFAATAEYTVLEEGAARPLGVRARAARQVASVAGVHACAALLTGAVLTAEDENSSVNLAGGLGATLTRPFELAGLRVTPFAGVRGLGAWTSASILGREVSSGGLSFGGEGGLAAGRGPWTLALRISSDAFDPALGATPYPDLAVRVAAALVF